MLLTSTVCNDVRVVNCVGIGPVRLFPDTTSVVSDVRFASDGESVPENPALLRMIDVTSPVVASHVTPDHLFVHGSDPIHVTAMACGYPAAAKKSINASTCVEHGTPGPAQYVDVCPVGVTNALAGNTGSSPSK